MASQNKSKSVLTFWEMLFWSLALNEHLIRKGYSEGLQVWLVSKVGNEGGWRRRRRRPMRSQRSGRRRLGRRGRRREESSAKVDAWRRGEGSGEREAGRAFGCLSTHFINSLV